MENKELIWVNKDIAKKYRDMESDQKKLEIVISTINQRKTDITNDIECLDNDLLQFKAFALRYKTELTKVYKEQQIAFEKLFEEVGDIQSKMFCKTKEIKKELMPIKSEVDNINKLLSEISTYKIEQLIDIINKFNNIPDDDKKLFKILLDANKIN